MQDPNAELQFRLWVIFGVHVTITRYWWGEDLGLCDAPGEQWRGTLRPLEWEERIAHPELEDPWQPEGQSRRAWSGETPGICGTLEQRVRGKGITGPSKPPGSSIGKTLEGAMPEATGPPSAQGRQTRRT